MADHGLEMKGHLSSVLGRKGFCIWETETGLCFDGSVRHHWACGGPGLEREVQRKEDKVPVGQGLMIQRSKIPVRASG